MFENVCDCPTVKEDASQGLLLPVASFEQSKCEVCSVN